MSPRLIQVVALVVAGGLVYGSSVLVPPINEGRRPLNMMGSDNPAENAPPDFVFAVQAFGAFRSLLVNLAFVRADTYKQQGRYYDAMELSRWICRLQPRFPAVWEFNAWNMAWNISVTTYTPEERWNWVYNGVRLLRDEGLRHNPRAINLYKQLAFIYVNKMAQPVDDFHFDYKRAWAWRIHLVLGSPPEAYGNLGGFEPGAHLESVVKKMELSDLFAASLTEAQRRGERPLSPDDRPLPESVLPMARESEDGPTPFEVAQKAAVDRLQVIADTPLKLDDLYAAHPAAREMVAKLAELGVKITAEPLTEEEFFHQTGLAWNFMMRYRQLADPPAMLTSLKKSKRHDEEVLQRFDQIVGVTRKDPDGMALVRHVQHRALAEAFKLNPLELIELTRVFGPMDWRTVDSSSLYWINRGLVAGNETISSFRNDKLNTTRLLFFSLRNLKNRNRLIFEPYPDDISRSYIDFTTDLNFIEPMHRAYLVYGPNFDNDPDKRGAGENYRTGHSSFLQESIRDLYFAGRIREAQKYYDFLRETYGLDQNGRPREAYLKPLRDFVFDIFYEMMDSQEHARGAISGFIDKAFNEMLRSEFDGYATAMRMAAEIHRRYSESRVDKIAESRMLPPIEQMVEDRLIALYFTLIPTTDVSASIRARLWKLLPYGLQRPVYDVLRPMFVEECQRFGFDLAAAYPEPPGMKEYREANPGRFRDARDQDITTPVQVRE
ncbi:MAG: hypothetical protein HRU75_10875 [Planctomycetia bacterium]|nr:MAG: hypothetical protein HRU75_10875 [Planctomycetia bacterium]